MANPPKLRAVFCEALDCPTAKEQADFLDRACQGWPELRARVELLLQANAEANSFLKEPGDRLLATKIKPVQEGPGTLLGPYKLLEKIGEGGFGLVYMAEQQQPVRRKVAIKIVKPGMDTRQVVARFEAERQALALMDHPNIARVLDAGETPSGRPHFVMELVRGVPITAYCDQNRLPLRQRLELFMTICQAVQHAHHKGIIHRDLKPSNVLVTQHDGVPVVKVIDFGIAKALGQPLTDKTLFTGYAQLLGTPLYMSPEQAELSGLDIDTRSDVYSLGVVLYELLTGITPFDKDKLAQAGFEEMRRILREEEPPRPSTRLGTLGPSAATVSAHRQSDPRQLSRLFRGELDWIVMKALEKDRTRRYETASAFAADVGRFLHDQPVAACPPSVWYRWRKFARRHQAALRTVAVVALGLLLAMGGIGWALWEQAAQESTRREELARRLAETERTVDLALGEAQQWHDQAVRLPSATVPQAQAVLFVWRQALAALGQAEAALSAGTADERLRQRVQQMRQQIAVGKRQDEQREEQARRQEQLLHDLEEARLVLTIWLETHFDLAGASAKYAQAFAAYGLPVSRGRATELGQRIRREEPKIRDALIVALHDWAPCAPGVNTAGLMPELLAIARAADDDDWRRNFREAWAAKNPKALRPLSIEARRQVLPANTLLLLAHTLNALGERGEAVAVLRWARLCHPEEFWIHYDLGVYLGLEKTTSLVALEERIGCYRAAMALRPGVSAVYNNLGSALTTKKEFVEATALLRKALAIQPHFTLAHFNLGNVYLAQNQPEEAIGAFREALKINPRMAIAYTNLGIALRSQRRWDLAADAFHQSLKIKPQNPIAHNGLGLVYRDTKQHDQASAEFRKAIAVDARFAQAHHNLGTCLQALNRHEEAVAAFRLAIAADPKLAEAHHQLGMSLQRLKRPEEATVAFRAAVVADPKLAEAWYHLASALARLKRTDEAIAAFRQASEIDKKYSYDLGNVLRAANRLDEAITAFRQAIDFMPKHVHACANLAGILEQQDQLDEALIYYRKAVGMNGKFALGHYGLGSVRLKQGQIAEARKHLQQVGQLLPDNAALRSMALAKLKQCDRLLPVEQRLPDLLTGKIKPTNNLERLAFIELCRLQRRFATASRLYEEAFASDAKLALPGAHRRLAAGAAILAADKQGIDGDQRDEQERSRLRKLAAGYLRADLEWLGQRLQAGKKEDRPLWRSQLEQWQREPNLMSVRHPETLAKMAPEEREVWRQLWADVAELLKKASPKE